MPGGVSSTGLHQPRCEMTRASTKKLSLVGLTQCGRSTWAGPRGKYPGGTSRLTKSVQDGVWSFQNAPCREAEKSIGKREMDCEEKESSNGETSRQGIEERPGDGELPDQGGESQLNNGETRQFRRELAPEDGYSEAPGEGGGRVHAGASHVLRERGLIRYGDCTEVGEVTGRKPFTTHEST
ncbi:hypothetical protein NDU88_006271 [Pleurodeles waltl]|uniref:Uncharacterized protein n=1 Tax=Pleurodeles waltl TaxID=8319 RepID=A0AAV7MDF9_PLEWA|nr:hypothetical protein NDU88_006271 [Pleurodeles waltl]